MRSSRLEIRGITKEIPTICEFPGAAEVVAGIKRLPRLSALQCQDAVDLPALQQLGKRFDIRERVGGRKRKTVPDIKIAVAVFTIRVKAVLRQVLIPIVGLIIERVGVSVANDEIQTMIIAAGEGSLQTIVI